MRNDLAWPGTTSDNHIAQLGVVSLIMITAHANGDSLSVGASIRASSTVSISSVLSPRQTTAFIAFPCFLQTLLPNNFTGFLQVLVGIANHVGRHHDLIKLLGTNVATLKSRITQCFVFVKRFVPDRRGFFIPYDQPHPRHPPHPPAAALPN